MIKFTSIQSKSILRWRRRDVTITSRCEEATFRLTGEDGVEQIEGIETFKYLGRISDCYYDNWTEVLRNVGKSHRVWNRLGKLIRREGAEP